MTFRPFTAADIAKAFELPDSVIPLLEAPELPRFTRPTAPTTAEMHVAQKAAIARAVQSADQARQQLHKEPAQNPQAYELPAPTDLPIFEQAQARALADQIDTTARAALHNANSGELQNALEGFREAAALTRAALAAAGVRS